MIQSCVPTRFCITAANVVARMESCTRHPSLRRSYCLPCEFVPRVGLDIHLLGIHSVLMLAERLPVNTVSIHLIYLWFIIYLMTPSAATLPYLTLLSLRSPGGTVKSPKTCGIVTVPTEHFPKTCEQRYRPNRRLN
jgi:hypothetical protein